MSRAVTLAGYAVVVAAMAVLQLRAARRHRLATAGAVLRTILRSPTLHLLLVAAWLWLGWHVFVRASYG